MSGLIVPLWYPWYRSVLKNRWLLATVAAGIAGAGWALQLVTRVIIPDQSISKAYSLPEVGSRAPSLLAFLISGAAIYWLGRSFYRRHLTQAELATRVLPMCAWCSKVAGNRGEWISMEQYLRKYLNTHFSHGFCPGCASAFERLIHEERLSKTE